MSRINLTKKSLLTACVVTTLVSGAGLAVYNKIERNVFEKDLLTAAQEYVKSNDLVIGNNESITTPATLLSNKGYFKSSNSFVNNGCEEFSFVTTTNVDGELKSEVNRVCTYADSQNNAQVEVPSDVVGFEDDKAFIGYADYSTKSPDITTGKIRVDIYFNQKVDGLYIKTKEATEDTPSEYKDITNPVDGISISGWTKIDNVTVTVGNGTKSGVTMFSKEFDINTDGIQTVYGYIDKGDTQDIAKVNFEVKTLDNIAPKIKVNYENNEIIYDDFNNKNHTLTVLKIKGTGTFDPVVTAFDNEVDVTSSIIITGNTSIDLSVAGKHETKYEIKDALNNTRTLTIVVNVLDPDKLPELIESAQDFYDNPGEDYIKNDENNKLWQDLQDAINNAQNVLDNPTNAEDLAEKTVELEKALNDVKTSDTTKTPLDQADLDRLEEIKEDLKDPSKYGNYSGDLKSAIEEALKNAEEAKEAKIKSDFEAKLEILETEYAKLILKPVVSDVTISANGKTSVKNGDVIRLTFNSTKTLADDTVVLIAGQTATKVGENTYEIVLNVAEETNNGKIDYSITPKDTDGMIGDVVEGTAKDITVDTKAPEINVSYDNTEWTQGPVEVTITSNEKLYGLGETWVENYDKENKEYTYTNSFTEPESNTITVTDEARNEAEVVYNVSNIDKKPATYDKPVISPANEYGYYTGTATITLNNISDNGGSGINRIKYGIGNLDEATGKIKYSWKNLNADEEAAILANNGGTFTIDFSKIDKNGTDRELNVAIAVVDNANNQSRKYIYNLKVDTIKPEVEYDEKYADAEDRNTKVDVFGEVSISNEDVKITDADVAGSNISYEIYEVTEAGETKIDDISNYFGGTDNPTVFIAKKVGTFKVKYVIRDKAGNNPTNSYSRTIIVTYNGYPDVKVNDSEVTGCKITDTEKTCTLTVTTKTVDMPLVFNVKAIDQYYTDWSKEESYTVASTDLENGRKVITFEATNQLGKKLVLTIKVLSTDEIDAAIEEALDLKTNNPDYTYDVENELWKDLDKAVEDAQNSITNKKDNFEDKIDAIKDAIDAVKGSDTTKTPLDQADLDRLEEIKEDLKDPSKYGNYSGDLKSAIEEALKNAEEAKEAKIKSDFEAKLEILETEYAKLILKPVVSDVTISANGKTSVKNGDVIRLTFNSTKTLADDTVVLIAGQTATKVGENTYEIVLNVAEETNNGKIDYSITPKDTDGMIGDVVEGTAKDITVDTKAPEINVSYDNTEWTQGPVEVTITSNEKLYGLGETWVENYDKENKEYTYTNSFTEPESKTITVTDEAGNEAEVVYNVSNIDKTPAEYTKPVITPLCNEDGSECDFYNGYYNGKAKVEITGITDGTGSGINRIKYGISYVDEEGKTKYKWHNLPENADLDLENGTLSFVIDFSKEEKGGIDRELSVAISVVDNVENQSRKYTDNINVDTINPEITKTYETIELDVNKDEDILTLNREDITTNASEEIIAVYYRIYTKTQIGGETSIVNVVEKTELTEATWKPSRKGTYTVEYTAIDKAGNVSNKITRTVKVYDKSALEEQIERFNELNKENYPSNQVTEIETMINEINEIKDSLTDQNEIDAKTEELKEAIDNLLESPVVTVTDLSIIDADGNVKQYGTRGDRIHLTFTSNKELSEKTVVTVYGKDINISEAVDGTYTIEVEINEELVKLTEGYLKAKISPVSTEEVAGKKVTKTNESYVIDTTSPEITVENKEETIKITELDSYNGYKNGVTAKDTIKLTEELTEEKEVEVNYTTTENRDENNRIISITVTYTARDLAGNITTKTNGKTINIIYPEVIAELEEFVNKALPNDYENGQEVIKNATINILDIKEKVNNNEYKTQEELEEAIKEIRDTFKQAKKDRELLDSLKEMFGNYAGKEDKYQEGTEKFEEIENLIEEAENKYSDSYTKTEFDNAVKNVQDKIMELNKYLIPTVKIVEFASDNVNNNKLANNTNKIIIEFTSNTDLTNTTINIGGKEYTIEGQKGQYRVEVPATEFVNGQKVGYRIIPTTASVTGSEVVSTEEELITIDTTAPVIELVVDGEKRDINTTTGEEVIATIVNSKTGRVELTFTEGTLTINGKETEAETSYDITKEGIYNIVLTDETGNETKAKVIVDTEAPVIKSGDKEIANGSVKVLKIGEEKVLTYEDATSGIKSVTVDGTQVEEINGTLDLSNLTENRSYNITVCDNVDLCTSITYVIDTVAPVIKDNAGNTIPDKGRKVLMNGETPVLRYEDEGGVETITVDGDSTTYTPNENNTIDLSNLKDGSHLVKVCDKAGYCTEITYVVDTVAPIITDNTGNIIPNNGTKVLMKGETPVLKYNDITSNISSITVNSDSTTYLPNENKTLDLSDLADGNHTIRICDEANNCTTITYVKDTTKPEISVEVTTVNPETGEPITSVITGILETAKTVRVGNKYAISNPIVNDAHATSDDVVISVNDTTINTSLKEYFIANGIIDGEDTFTASGIGSYKITYEVTDEAGNYSKVEFILNVLDGTNPNLEVNAPISSALNTWYNNNNNKLSNIIIKATDNESDIKSISYQVIKGLANNYVNTDDAWNVLDIKSGKEVNTEFTIDKDGEEIWFAIKVVNKHGLETIYTSKNDYIYNIDTVSPTINNISIVQNGESEIKPNENGWFNTNVTNSIDYTDTSKDNYSTGIEKLEYAVCDANKKDENGNIIDDDCSEESSWSWSNINLENTFTLSTNSSKLMYKARITDNAGNTSTTDINGPIKLDTEAPTITINEKDLIEGLLKAEASKTDTYKPVKPILSDNFTSAKSLEETKQVENNVNLTILGNGNTVTYTVVDEAGNRTTKTFTVIVEDTTDPTITFNKDISLELNSNKNDTDFSAGVILDDNYANEEILRNNLTIDTSSLDTSKAGTYTVSYTTNDGQGNTVTVTRKVTVELADLDTIKDLIIEQNNCEAGKECYNKDLVDNYVWYSGRLWRIFKVNEDGTVALVTEESVIGTAFDKSSVLFHKSSINTWLNGIFLTTLDSSKTSLLENDATYCRLEIFASEVDDVRTSCPEKRQVKTTVGLLTLDDYYKTGGKNGYLNNGTYYFTMTPATTKTMWIINNNGLALKDYGPNEPYGIRPVITMNSLNIVSGIGTNENPYMIKEYKSNVTSGTALNSRKVGEYVNFVGKTWRIVEANGTSTKLVLNEQYKDSQGEYARISFEDATNLTDNTLSNYLNTEVYNNLFSGKQGENLVMTYNWNRKSLTKGDSLSSMTSASTIKGKVGLLNVGEQGSTGGTRNTSGYVDRALNWSYTINPDYNGKTTSWYFTFPGTSEFYSKSGDSINIKPAIYLNENAVLDGSGLGTFNNPYTVKVD